MSPISVVAIWHRTQLLQHSWLCSLRGIWQPGPILITTGNLYLLIPFTRSSAPPIWPFVSDLHNFLLLGMLSAVSQTGIAFLSVTSTEVVRPRITYLLFPPAESSGRTVVWSLLSSFMWLLLTSASCLILTHTLWHASGCPQAFKTPWECAREGDVVNDHIRTNGQG